jgi:hypothetical protein
MKLKKGGYRMNQKDKKELKKLDQDIKKHRFAVLDQEHWIRIDPEQLAFFTRHGGKLEKMPRTKVQLVQDLTALERIFVKKFGNRWVNVYDMEMLKKDPAKFTERMIRAAEICTLNYVLQTGLGGLNKHNDSLVKGKKHFLWEHE